MLTCVSIGTAMPQHMWRTTLVLALTFLAAACARLFDLYLLGIFLSLPPFSLGALGLQIHITVCSFYMDSGDPNSASHLHNTYFIR